MKLQWTGRFAFAFALGTTWITVPLSMAAQSGPPFRGFGPPGAGIELLESVLEDVDEIGLSPEQRGRLEEFQAQSDERTATAREVLEVWRAEVEAERDQVGGDDPQGGPRPQDRRPFGQRPEPTREVRDALRTLADERVAMLSEIEATLTVEQMRRVEGAVRERGPRLRGGRAGPRGRVGRPRFGVPRGWGRDGFFRGSPQSRFQPNRPAGFGSRGRWAPAFRRPFR